MNEVTLNKMRGMKMYGMYAAFKTAVETGNMDDFSLDQFVSMMIDAEWDDKNNRKIERAIKNARFNYKASIEDLIFEQSRNIDRNKILRLAECDFIVKNQNVLITGSTGVGKSYIATALGYQACILGYKVAYYNTTKLFSLLRIAKADGSYLKELLKIQRQNLLILDDFGLQPLDTQTRIALLEIVEDRNNKGSMIITSQVPVQGWYEIVGEKTIADAILDRLIHPAHRIELQGESMRRKRKLLDEKNN